MKRLFQLFLVLFFFFCCYQIEGQEISFIALGDMDFDRLDDHEPDYVITHPQDFRQIVNEYPQYTFFYIPKFLNLIKKQVNTLPNVKAVVQLGGYCRRCGWQCQACQKDGSGFDRPALFSGTAYILGIGER